ncbi:MAG TPA: T9SS type A sorting domain-containing protein [Cytophagaceae bacterium]
MEKKLQLRAIATTAFLIMILTGFFNFSSGEGSRQLQPVPESKTKLIVGNDRVPNYATYTSDSANRLYIHISKVTEKIYLGFGKVFYDNDGLLEVPDLYYRIKAPNGNIIVPGTKVPKTGKGFIATSATAVGPIGLSGSAVGYDPIVVENLAVTGDYYLEFSKTNTDVFETPSSLPRAIFEDFDITVGDGTTAKPGRLWSYRWHLIAQGSEVETQASFFVYTKDSEVTNLNLNRMQPYSFAIVSNQMGSSTSKNFQESRKSSNGRSDYPEYKIFLNDPDHNAFPSYKSSIAVSSVKNNGFVEKGYCLEVKYNSMKEVMAELLLDFDSDGIRDIEDRVLTHLLYNGSSCISWDGKNGAGTAVPLGLDFKIQAQILTGLTNLPIFDPENNAQGLVVSLVRPQEDGSQVLSDNLRAAPLEIFWDDSQVGGTSNFEGCLAMAAQSCHLWRNSFGNDKTMNTWWEVSTTTKIFTVRFDNALSTNTPNGAPNIDFNAEIAPNPMNDQSTFKISGDPGVVYLEILNANGNIVYRQKNYNINDEVDAPAIRESGVYIIRLSNDRINKALKLIKM